MRWLEIKKKYCGDKNSTWKKIIHNSRSFFHFRSYNIECKKWVSQFEKKTIQLFYSFILYAKSCYFATKTCQPSAKCTYWGYLIFGFLNGYVKRKIFFGFFGYYFFLFNYKKLRLNEPKVNYWKLHENRKGLQILNLWHMFNSIPSS